VPKHAPHTHGQTSWTEHKESLWRTYLAACKSHCASCSSERPSVPQCQVHFSAKDSFGTSSGDLLGNFPVGTPLLSLLFDSFSWHMVWINFARDPGSFQWNSQQQLVYRIYGCNMDVYRGLLEVFFGEFVSKCQQFFFGLGFCDILWLCQLNFTSNIFQFCMAWPGSLHGEHEGRWPQRGGGWIRGPRCGTAANLRSQMLGSSIVAAPQRQCETPIFTCKLRPAAQLSNQEQPVIARRCQE